MGLSGMRKVFLTSILFIFALDLSSARQVANPFIGRWDFTTQTDTGTKANWIKIAEQNGKPALWFQPSGGHFIEIKDFKLDGSHLSFTAAAATEKHPATTWDLTAAGDGLTGVQKTGEASTPLIGVKAPALDRKAPSKWGQPKPLFDGKDLNGWEPIGNVSQNHWTVKDGMLFNEAHGANLKTTDTFTDFKLHFEVNCPEKANSGFYLRGRYELQLEYEPGDTEPIERSMGSIYGRVAPSQKLPRKPAQWESFDVTLVGRSVTVSRNGVNIINHKQIDGITGGALDAHEGEAGPFYIQGDHTGGLMFRNITVAVPAS